VLDRARFSAAQRDDGARYKAGTVKRRSLRLLRGHAGRARPANGSRCASVPGHDRSCRAYRRLPSRWSTSTWTRGDLVVLTTATNRFITELTALYLGIEHLIATDCELADGRFTGRTRAR
jgi:hypothetical protein